MVGRTVLQYQLIAKLGAGGMGEVYKSLDTRLNRFVAMKILSAGMSTDPESRRRFIREAQSASALNHPNIITIYDIVHDGDDQFMIMEFVDGRTLGDVIAREGLPPALVLRYSIQMAEALCAAHDAGIIHRDLKPANIMITASGLVKLLDFGLAKVSEWTPSDDNGATVTAVHNPLTVQGAIMGTVNYMSPEQAEGKRIDARSDIFSFGAVMYEMLTGRPPFRGESLISTLSAVLRDDVQPIPELTPGVPPGLEAVVARCLMKDPDQRFQTMHEVKHELLALQRKADSGILDSPPTVRTLPPPPAPNTGKKIVLAVAVAVLLLTGGAAWFAFSTRSTRQRPAPPPVSQTTDPSSVSPFPDQPQTTAPLTNDNIIEMVKANVDPAVIASQIRASKTAFNLSPAEVIRLSQAGVGASLIEAMRDPHAPPPVAPPLHVVLSDGVPVHLVLAQDIPGDAAAGDPVRLKVDEAVEADSSVVIPKGATAVGAIVDGAKKKILGFGGKMTFRLETVAAVNGQRVSLRITPAPDKKGVSKRPVAPGTGKLPKDLAAVAGSRYVGYVDGSNNLVLKP